MAFFIAKKEKKAVSTPFPFVTQPHEPVYLQTVSGDGKSTSTPFLMAMGLLPGTGATQTGTVSSFTGFLNNVPYGVYNAVAPTLSNGNGSPFQLDSSGNLKVSGGGGTSNPTNTYNTTAPTLTNGQTSVFQCNSRGSSKVIPSDGPNDVAITTTGANAKSNTANRLSVDAILSGFNGSTWDSLASGKTAAITSLTGILNTIPYAQYNTTAPTPTNGQGVAFQCDASGNIQVNPGVLSGAPSQTNGGGSVATSTGQVLAANATRKYLQIQNQDAANPIWILYGAGSATANGNCEKLAAGQTRIWDGGYIPNTAIQAISTGGSVIINVIEG